MLGTDHTLDKPVPVVREVDAAKQLSPYQRMLEIAIALARFAPFSQRTFSRNL